MSLNWNSKLVFPIINSFYKCSSVNAMLTRFYVFHFLKCLFPHEYCQILTLIHMHDFNWAYSLLERRLQNFTTFFWYLPFHVTTLYINHFQLKVWWNLLNCTLKWILICENSLCICIQVWITNENIVWVWKYTCCSCLGMKILVLVLTSGIN